MTMFRFRFSQFQPILNSCKLSICFLNDSFILAKMMGFVPGCCEIFKEFNCVYHYLRFVFVLKSEISKSNAVCEDETQICSYPKFLIQGMSNSSIYLDVYCNQLEQLKAAIQQKYPLIANCKSAVFFQDKLESSWRKLLAYKQDVFPHTLC